MNAGECWIFDSWRLHNVINSGAENRTHLVIDLAGSSRFWKMVRTSIELSTDPTGAIPKDCLREVPFKPNEPFDIKTERYNAIPIMSPGELESLVKELIADFSGCADNDPTIVEEYRNLLLDFSKDWRECYLQYGIQESGINDYQKLLHRIVKSLHPNPRILVTKSNKIGVNPIIMQRIIRAALIPDQLATFTSGC